ncbi:hypothetical protein MR532_03305 [bacterium]|nr:hypothetical protein [bacterium]
MEDIFVFRRFMTGDIVDESHTYRDAAIEKLQTLFPGKRLTVYDDFTIGVEDVCCEGRFALHVLGLVDGEIPAIQNTESEEVITYRIP